MSNAEAYITLFFQDIEQLNQCLAIYLNILVPIKNKYKSIKDQDYYEELTENDADDLKDIVKEIRYSSVRINTKLQALQSAFPTLNKDNKKKINDYYLSITRDLIPKYEVVEAYIIELNKLFISGIGNQLLVKSNQYYESLTSANNISGYDVNE